MDLSAKSDCMFNDLHIFKRQCGYQRLLDEQTAMLGSPLRDDLKTFMNRLMTVDKDIRLQGSRGSNHSYTSGGNK